MRIGATTNKARTTSAILDDTADRAKGRRLAASDHDTRHSATAAGSSDGVAARVPDPPDEHHNSVQSASGNGTDGAPHAAGAAETT
jgi:hypothetical protein